MMEVGRHKVKCHMTLDFDFSGIRIVNGYMVPVDWNLSVDIIAPEKKSKAKVNFEHMAGIAYQRMYYWLNTNLPQVVIVDATNEDDIFLANYSANMMMYCPTDASDDVIIQLLHSKLSKIAGEYMLVGEMRLKSNDTTAKYTFNCQKGEYQLPDTTDYCNEEKIRDTIPWWFRDDGFCFEFINYSEESNDEFFNDVVDPMAEFDIMIAESLNNQSGITKEPAKIVQIEKWKPKKV